jgi:hypothetical protein
MAQAKRIATSKIKGAALTEKKACSKMAVANRESAI